MINKQFWDLLFIFFWIKRHRQLDSRPPSKV